jgi:hypothetical protein
VDNSIRWLNGIFLQWICAIAVSLPFLIIAVNATRRQQQVINLRLPAQLALFFFVTLALTRLEPIWPFTERLWQAMLLEAIWALIFIFTTRAVARAGLTLRISPAAWRDSLIATGLLLLFVIIRGAALKLTGLGPGANGPPGLEFLLFQLTMPGLAEELAYRGVIQPGLNEVLGRPWRLLGASLGWGWVITSALFWAIHAFRVDPPTQLSFYWPTLTMQLWVGLALGWLRERSGSIAPAIIAHNLVNVCWSLT